MPGTTFVSWSGGKDSCFAAHLASRGGFQMAHLFTMVTEDGAYSRSHGLGTSILALQAEAIGVPLVTGRVGDTGYEQEFKRVAGQLKEKGVRHGIFGDIDVGEHREWVERVCGDIGVAAHFPLWGMAQEEIMAGFIDSGFRSLVVAARRDIFPAEVLGRAVDRPFLSHLATLQPRVTPCGELGEYHTFVTDGPLFQKRLKLVETKATARDGHHILEIISAELEQKEIAP